jgi:hypothetical protein
VRHKENQEIILPALRFSRENIPERLCDPPPRQLIVAAGAVSVHLAHE